MQRPRSPAVLSGCARCAQLPAARIKAVLQQLPLIPALICLLLTPNADFSSRLTLSLPLTHAHTSSVPGLPPSRLLSGERQLDGTIHLQESSLGLVLHPLPGSRRSRVSNVEELLKRFGAGRKRGSELRCPPSARRLNSSAQVPVIPLLADRSQLMPSQRLCAESN